MTDEQAVEALKRPTNAESGWLVDVTIAVPQRGRTLEQATADVFSALEALGVRAREVHR